MTQATHPTGTTNRLTSRRISTETKAAVKTTS
jgi:hypothetical protein